jgi:hypothetical protein
MSPDVVMLPYLNAVSVPRHDSFEPGGALLLLIFFGGLHSVVASVLTRGRGCGASPLPQHQVCAAHLASVQELPDMSLYPGGC